MALLNSQVKDGGGKVSSNEELAKEFKKYQDSVDYSEWTIKSCGYTLDMFFELLDGQNCIEADVEDLRDFFNELKERDGNHGSSLSPESIRKHINNLASFYNFLEFEDYIEKSSIQKFREHYLKPYLKSHQQDNSGKRQIISVEKFKELVNVAMNPRDKAVLMVLGKTGIRLGTLLELDINDVDFEEQSIHLKPNNKRSNLTVFFDAETAKVLKRWLDARKNIANDDEDALFVTQYGERPTHKAIGKMVKKYAEQISIHDDDSSNLQDRFTSHCLRYWFTYHLRESGMAREYIKELRGDSRSDTMDTYYQITDEELKREYLKHIPKLGI